MPTFTLKLSAESKDGALKTLHDLMTEKLESELPSLGLDIEEEGPRLDDDQVDVKVLEVAKLHKPLCPSFEGKVSANGFYDREESQDYKVDLDNGKAKEDGFVQDGDYGTNTWTSILCQGCGGELWPNPGKGVMPDSPRG